MIAITPRFDRHSRAAFLTACLTLLVSGVAFRGVVQALNVYLQKEPVELRASLSLIPTTLGPWRAVGEDRLYEAATIEALGTDKYLDRSYALDGGTRDDVLKVHVAYYTGMIDTVPHVPDRCFDAAGLNVKTLPNNISLPIDQSAWTPDSEGTMSLATNTVYNVAWVRDHGGRIVKVHLPTGDFVLRTLEFEDEKQQGWRIFGGYFFIANNRMTPAPEGVKMLAFDPREKFAYYCKVQYTFMTRDASEQRFVTHVADHLKYLIPELMRCLPDWAEVERRTANPPTSITPSPQPISGSSATHHPSSRAVFVAWRNDSLAREAPDPIRCTDSVRPRTTLESSNPVSVASCSIRASSAVACSSLWLFSCPRLFIESGEHSARECRQAFRNSIVPRPS